MEFKEKVIEAIHKVEHPEVAMSLVDLGMVRDIVVNEKDVIFTLVVPFLGIPEIIRNMMISSVQKAIEEQGGTLKEVNIAVMTEEERTAFFTKEQQNWKM